MNRIVGQPFDVFHLDLGVTASFLLKLGEMSLQKYHFQF